MKIYGEKIQNADASKFLGVHFDTKLDWKTHINHLKNKTNNALNILKKLSNTSWGADRTSLLRVYTSHIRSILDYGSIVYNSAKPSNIKKLNSVQNQGIRLSIGAFRTSPVPSLQAEANILPLDL